MNALQKFSLEGKVALVTGGSRGLGRAMAEALGDAGAAVAVTARTLASAQAAAEELSGLGIRAYGVQLEVSEVEDVERAVEQVSTEFGEIDVLLNNAGIGVAGRAFETPDEAWHDVFSVNVGSMSAEIVNQPRWQASYLSSKAAVHQLTKALAAEWAPHGIRVNAMAPGYVLTEMSPVDQPEYKEWCVDPAAMKRYGLPPELGPVAIFLASEASSFMTGSIVKVDGGFTLF